MALPAGNHIEVRTDGSDTLNAGIFNPAASNMATNLVATNANTASPVVTSATYSFQAGDVGHWLFIKSGTNWTPGWYPIVSVNAGAATIDATLGAVTLYEVFYPLGARVKTSAGCATVASPTGGTWAIDYSRSSAAAFSLTGLTTSAANAIILTAAATVAMVGNGVQITGGTNFTPGVYSITAVSAGVSITVDRNCTTAAGAAGTAGLGGAVATPGYGAFLLVGGNRLWIRAGTYTMTTATAQVSGGLLQLYRSDQQGTYSNNLNFVVGYQSVRGDLGTKPQLHAGALTGLTYGVIGNQVSPYSSAVTRVINLHVNGNNGSGNTGIYVGNSGPWLLQLCKVENCPSRGIEAGQCIADLCRVDNCGYGYLGTNGYGRVSRTFAKNCTTYGFQLYGGYTINDCIASKCATGFLIGAGYFIYSRLTAYACTTQGIQLDLNFGNVHALLYSCISWGNGQYGYRQNTRSEGLFWNCASGQNTSGASDLPAAMFNNIALTANPFVDPENDDFRLNDVPGGGALCRSIGHFPLAAGMPITADFGDLGAVQAAASHQWWGM